jgi:uncharacterized protein YbcC (UPF0753/DUF2309 family)
MNPLRIALAVDVLVLVALVALYSAPNLRGQRRRGRFAALLATTGVGLLVMVIGSGLPALAAGWTLSGWATAGLVGHRGDEAARRASRLVARRLALGDLALWGAVLTDAAGVGAGWTGLLLAGAVAVRSALVPFQRWLPETAEAPSPVSALLHAGVVNGGGMAALLQWPDVAASWAGRALLLGTGLASVALGLAGLRLRADVKGRLAASTTAQMGLAATTLGLGLPGIALIHLLGHSAWKAWLFLRAGGAPARMHHAPSRRTTPWPVTVAFGLLAAVATAITSLAVGGPQGTHPLVLPALLALALGVVAVHEALCLPRVRNVDRHSLALAAAGFPVVYVGWLAVLEHLTQSWFGAWGPSTVTASPTVAALVAVVVVVVAALASRLRPSSSGAFATAVAATLLPPQTGTVRRILARRPQPPTVSVTEHDADDVVALARTAGTAIGPAWPLHSLVAANPLAGLESWSVEDAAALVYRIHGTDPRPSLTVFLELRAIGRVEDDALWQALVEHRHEQDAGSAGLRHDGRDLAVARLLKLTADAAERAAIGAPMLSLASDLARPSGGRPLSEVLDLQAAAWTARAWGGSEPTSPYGLWRQAAQHRGHDLSWGLPGGRALARRLPADPAEAISALWTEGRPLVGGQSLCSYLTSLLATGRGWAGHAQWRDRTAGSPDALLQLLALRMALDLLLARTAPGTTVPTLPSSAQEANLVAVWQRALDLTARSGLLSRVSEKATALSPPLPSQVQSVWCIDARSERLRRHLETYPGNETLGFAGFFGAAVQHQDADGLLTDLYPGPLQPSAQVTEASVQLSLGAAVRRLVTRVGQSPVAAFTYAEASGLPALLGTAGATLAPNRWRSAAPARDEHTTARLPRAQAVAAGEVLLRATGMGARLAPVVILVGHGSSTENNAFAAAYDCGACGGHQGWLNAQLVANGLNDHAVRRELADRGLSIPADTVFLAASHDTTTDEVRILGETSGSGLATAAEQLRAAGVAASQERTRLLPVTGRLPHLRSVRQRAADWAEPMPEWGLAGVTALVVGPRRITSGLDFEGRVFLHSYEAQTDPDGSVLEQVMTGPVVVTHWISSQYYWSSAAPDLLGSGDKTTHNPVGAVGVLTGAHGDLRSGLPWQALSEVQPEPHLAGRMRHLPTRHLVVLVADPDLALEVVRRHAALHEPVGNGWMQLVVLPPGGGQPLELDRTLHWQPCWAPVPDPLPGTAPALP